MIYLNLSKGVSITARLWVLTVLLPFDMVHLCHGLYAKPVIDRPSRCSLHAGRMPHVHKYVTKWEYCTLLKFCCTLRVVIANDEIHKNICFVCYAQRSMVVAWLWWTYSLSLLPPHIIRRIFNVSGAKIHNWLQIVLRIIRNISWYMYGRVQ